MAESLGDALLTIRTDDGTFYADLTRAKGAAEQLGGSMDKTRASADRLSGEMVETGSRAATMGRNFETSGRAVTQSAGAQRAGMQQLSFQLNDVATMYALGARPMQIFASQSGQVIQAVQLMTGGTSRLAAFLGGPWGIALTSAVVVLTPFIGKLFEAEKALEAVELAGQSLGNSQDILADAFDLTTGRINDQTGALRANLAARIAVERFEADELARNSTKQLQELRKGRIDIGQAMLGRLRSTAGPESGIIDRLNNGEIGQGVAINLIADGVQAGRIDPQKGRDTIEAIENQFVAFERQQRIDQAEAAFNGDEGALQGFLRGGGRGGAARGGRAATGPSQAEIDARYEDDLVGITQRILSARQQIATSAGERAEIEARQVEWERRQAIADIEADEHYSELQKSELIAATTRLADAEQQAIEFAEQRELEGDALALADERYRAEQDALQIQLELADSEGERKALALALLDAEERFLEARLKAVLASETASDAEQQRAELALAALRQTSGDRREAVARANETTLDRYLRGLNQTPEQINEALDLIQIDGLDALNDGLADAISGVRSLGEVFTSIADQIISDLLRIAIRQAIIAPLAGALFGGGGGGPLNLLAGIPAFAGGRARGGTIDPGTFAIVGEEGPELAFAGPGGIGVLSNTDTRRALAGDGGSGTSVTINMPVNASGADSAAVSRLSSRLDQIERELPGTIVRTVQDADDRRTLNLKGRR